jgi:hypothetical protein
MAPLLRELVAKYAATGLAPAYLPKDECRHGNPAEQDHQDGAGDK